MKPVAYFVSILLLFAVTSLAQPPEPQPVTDLVIQVSENLNDIILTWSRPLNADSFQIHAGDSLDFQATETTQIGSTPDTTFTHIDGLIGSEKRFYMVVSLNNSAPYQPYNPLPADSAQNQSIEVDLSWSCSDPDGDPLTYDVYFGTSSTPPLVSSGQTATTYDPGTLAGGTPCYWQIVAHDNHGHSTPGPVWWFTTEGYAGMVLVPAGPYQMGATYQSYAQPIHTVNVPAFYIDVYEVTNAQYKAFCDATSRAYPPDPGFSGMPNYFTNPTYANFPVVAVTWYDAKDYATWAGKRLPTEAEWERAAKGNADNRLYPWGDTWVGANANIWDNPADGYTYTSPVGNYPNGISPAGCYDMAGNVWEWCEDDWHGDYNGAPTDGSAWIDTPRGSTRVKRGGSWNYYGTRARCANRSASYPTYRLSSIGFRCAGTP